MIQISLICTTLALIVVCLRIYSRAFIIRGLKADDCQSTTFATSGPLADL